MSKIYSIVLIGILSAGPVGAQEDKGEMREGVDLLQRGTRLLLEGLMSELGPALKNLEDMVVDLNAYHAPEVLPNGDIIIRRKEPLEIDPPADGEIDL